MSGKRMGVVHFSVCGDFITDTARQLWQERQFSKALKLLGCCMGISHEQILSILFGKQRLTGVNNVQIVADDWALPKYYAGSLEQALQEGEKFAELTMRREQDAWDYAQANWQESRMMSAFRSVYFNRLISLVGREQAELIDETMTERYMERRIGAAVEDDAWGLYENEDPLDAITKRAMGSLADRLEAAGFDSSALANSEQVLHRGYNTKPTLDERMESINGWLLPNGNYYGCGPMEHVGTAAQLLPEGTNDPEQEAEERGWIKLVKHITGFSCIGRKKPTKKQLNKLFDYAELHQRDYEEMIENLPK